MTDANPFAAPVVTGARAGTDDRVDFKDLTTKELNKLYFRSCNIGAIGVLCVLGGILLPAQAVMMLTGAIPASSSNGVDQMVSAGFAVVGLFELIVAVGCFIRPAWVRPCGIIVCSLMLLSIGLGTLIGIVGIVGFAKGKALFGPDRVRHRTLKAEYKHRKRNRIA